MALKVTMWICIFIFYNFLVDDKYKKTLFKIKKHSRNVIAIYSLFFLYTFPKYC